MIYGIGIDTVKITRVEKAIRRQHFLESVFTPAEQEEIAIRKSRCASDFAGKEAVVKMFGTGFGKIGASDISILREESGRPYVVLHGRAKELAEQERIDKIHISITNTDDLASAFVIGERVEG